MSPMLTPASVRRSLAVIESPSNSALRALRIADAQLHRGVHAGVGWGAHHATSVPRSLLRLGVRHLGGEGTGLHITRRARDPSGFSATSRRQSLAEAAVLDLLE